MKSKRRDAGEFYSRSGLSEVSPERDKDREVYALDTLPLSARARMKRSGHSVNLRAIRHTGCTRADISQ